MSMTLRDLREEAVACDPELQRLAREHSQYDAQLQQLSSDPYLSAEHILLEADLKKKKLHLKDEMERRLALLAKSGITH
jgi:uncharacterized protein YdcH (DUF465 family)